jgi:hypothetical protein
MKHTNEKAPPSTLNYDPNEEETMLDTKIHHSDLLLNDKDGGHQDESTCKDLPREPENTTSTPSVR